MVDLSSYPYSSYVPSIAAAGIVAAIVGISLIAWLIQSYQIRFQPPRPNILLLISHLAIFSELIIRAIVGMNETYSKGVYISSTILLAVGLRLIVVGNFSLLSNNSRLSRIILIGALVSVISSGILMTPAGLLSYNTAHVQTSFIFRQISSSIFLALTIFFYPIWYWTKTIQTMTNQAIILVTISSFLSMIVAIFILIQSLPDYYSKINSHEGWFYGFQMGPIVITLITWSILHPKRSLAFQTKRANPEDTSIVF